MTPGTDNKALSPPHYVISTLGMAVKRQYRTVHRADRVCPEAGKLTRFDKIPETLARWFPPCSRCLPDADWRAPLGPSPEVVRAWWRTTT